MRSPEGNQPRLSGTQRELTLVLAFCAFVALLLGSEAQAQSCYRCSTSASCEDVSSGAGKDRCNSSIDCGPWSCILTCSVTGDDCAVGGGDDDNGPLHKPPTAMFLVPNGERLESVGTTLFALAAVPDHSGVECAAS